MQRCNHADAQDDTKDKDQDTWSLILDKPQGRSRCRKTPVRQYLAMEVSESYGRDMIHKLVRIEWVKCTTAIFEAHLAQTTCTPQARSKTSTFCTVDERRVSGLQVTCSIRTAQIQTSQKHYVLYGMATANKFAEPVGAKPRTAGCKTSLTQTKA
jgi:hypothetical protein